MSKHIAFFVTSLNVGGVERAFVNLANSFVDSGYKVDFVVCQYIGNLKNELNDKANVVVLSDSRLRKSIFQLLRYIKNSNADCIITGPTYPNIVALIANFLAFNKMKVIVSQHSYQDIEMNNLGLLGRVAPLLIKATYNYASKVVCVSKGVATDMIKNYNVKPEKTATIYNAVIDFSFFEKAADNIQNIGTTHIFDKKYIVAVGRLVTVKNYPFMIAAYSKLRKLDPDFEYDLIILGEGEELGNLKDLIKKNNLQNFVHLLGSFANPLPIIKNASLFIHTSFSEAMPLVYVEALALKIPVVTINNRGALEILENVKTKKIIQKHDEDEFISAILNMLKRKFLNDDFPDFSDFKSEKIRDAYLKVIYSN
jgi:glycosyltransferase involved in cell wall biosynthesis